MSDCISGTERVILQWPRKPCKDFPLINMKKVLRNWLKVKCVMCLMLKHFNLYFSFAEKVWPAWQSNSSSSNAVVYLKILLFGDVSCTYITHFTFNAWVLRKNITTLNKTSQKHTTKVFTFNQTLVKKMFSWKSGSSFVFYVDFNWFPCNMPKNDNKKKLK